MKPGDWESRNLECILTFWYNNQTGHAQNQAKHSRKLYKTNKRGAQ